MTTIRGLCVEVCVHSCVWGRCVKRWSEREDEERTEMLMRAEGVFETLSTNINEMLQMWADFSCCSEIC